MVFRTPKLLTLNTEFTLNPELNPKPTPKISGPSDPESDDCELASEPIYTL